MRTRYSLISSARAETVSARVAPRFGLVAKHEAVVLDCRAAARRVDEDGVEPAALESRHPGRDRGRAAVAIALVVRPMWCVSAPQQPTPFAITTSMPWRVSRRMVASLMRGRQHVLGAAGRAARRGAPLAPAARWTCGACGRARRRQPRRRERQHRAHALRDSVCPGSRRPNGRAEPGAAQRRPEQAGPRQQRAEHGAQQAVGQGRRRRSPRCSAGRDRPGACSSRPTGRSSCRTGRTGSGRHA